MMIAILLAAVSPVAAIPAEAAPQICRVVKDHPLKSKRSVACGTAQEWIAFDKAYKTATQKENRKSVSASAAYAGVGSGY